MENRFGVNRERCSFLNETDCAPLKPSKLQWIKKIHEKEKALQKMNVIAYVLIK